MKSDIHSVDINAYLLYNSSIVLWTTQNREEICTVRMMVEPMMAWRGTDGITIVAIQSAQLMQ